MKLKSELPNRLQQPKMQQHISLRRAQSGFTLIEFVVASALGLMIILAIGGAYVATQRVNETASMRVERQQELRLASSLLVRDARMAGSFGCASLPALTSEGLSVDHTADWDIDEDASYFNVNAAANDDRVFATRIVAGDSDVMSGIDAAFSAANGSDVVIFNYGINTRPVLGTTIAGVNTLSGLTVSNASFFDSTSDADESQARVVLSSCYRADVLQRSQLNIAYNASDNDDDDAITFKSSVGDIAMYKTGTNVNEILTQTGALTGVGHSSSQATLSNLYAVAYVVGKAQGDTQADALYRFELQADGAWTPPQLLSRNISNLKAEYVYINNCVVKADAAATENYFVSQEAFLEKNDSSGDAQLLTPNGVQLKLTPSAVAANSNASDTITSDADLQTMVLNAAMRGADACTAD